MQTGITALRTSADADESMKIIPLLLLLMTFAACVIVVLAFQQWVDFGITQIRGTDAEAATGISDGWFVAGLASGIVILVGGVVFRQQLAPILLPMIAFAAVFILAIAGFDTITNWHASGIHPDNPGILVQSQGDPTAVPYAISALAILIALLAAVVRGIQLRVNPHLLGDLAGEADQSVPPPERPPKD